MVDQEIRYIIGQIIEKGNDWIKVKDDTRTMKIKFFDEELISNVEVSEVYKIQYIDNIKGNITYHNGKSIGVYADHLVIPISPVETKVSESVKPKYISDTTINCLLMQSVQYSKDSNISLDKATDEVLKSYKKITSLITLTG